MVWRFFSQGPELLGRRLGAEVLDYSLVRQLMKAAVDETSRLSGSRLSVILPYGFELLGGQQSSIEERKPYWPAWPQRHYPALGYPDHLMRRKAEALAHVFLSQFNYQLEGEYPAFYDKLKHMDVYQNGQYSRLQLDDLGRLDTDLTDLEMPQIMTMEIFPLAHSFGDILDHYANYLCCLFGAIAPDSHNLPEIRDFDISKTRRNRLFQEYIMCEAMAEVVSEVPSRSPQQTILLSRLFSQLKIQNPTELIRFAPTSVMEATLVEKQIRDELIFPRFAMLRSLLKGDGKKTTMLVSKPYYNGSELITCQMDEEYAKGITAFVKDSYAKFPQDVVNYTERYDKVVPTS